MNANVATNMGTMSTYKLKSLEVYRHMKGFISEAHPEGLGWCLMSVYHIFKVYLGIEVFCVALYVCICRVAGGRNGIKKKLWNYLLV